MLERCASKRLSVSGVFIFSFIPPFNSSSSKQINPLLDAETDRFDDEHVAFPMANLVTDPARVGVLEKRPPIGPDGASNVLLLEEHQHPSRNLHNFSRIPKD